MNHEEKSNLTKQKETAKTTKIIQKQNKSEKKMTMKLIHTTAKEHI